MRLRFLEYESFPYIHLLCLITWFTLFYFQLAACSSLCYLFQESSFSELDLFECLPTCWTMCFKLTEDVQEFDSKVWIPIVHLLFPSPVVYARVLSGSLTHCTILNVIFMLLVNPCLANIILPKYFPFIFM